MLFRIDSSKFIAADLDLTGLASLGYAADRRVGVDIADGEDGVDFRVLQQVRAHRLGDGGRRAEGSRGQGGGPSLRRQHW